MIQEKTKYNVVQIKMNNYKIKEYETNLTANKINADGLILRLIKSNNKLRSENVMLFSLRQDILRTSNGKDWHTRADLDQLKIDRPMPEEALANDECEERIIRAGVQKHEEYPSLCISDAVQEAYEELIRFERYEECKLIKQLQDHLREANEDEDKYKEIIYKLISLP